MAIKCPVFACRTLNPPPLSPNPEVSCVRPQVVALQEMLVERGVDTEEVLARVEEEYGYGDEDAAGDFLDGADEEEGGDESTAGAAGGDGGSVMGWSGSDAPYRARLTPRNSHLTSRVYSGCHLHICGVSTRFCGCMLGRGSGDEPQGRIQFIQWMDGQTPSVHTRSWAGPGNRLTDRLTDRRVRYCLLTCCLWCRHRRQGRCLRH
jgi:hypothetical protein